MQSLTISPDGRATLTLRSSVVASYRVARALGALDDPSPRELVKTLVFDAPPDVSEDWRVGLITGGSGSGKSRVASALYPNAVDSGAPWDDSRSVLDHFGPRSYEELASALGAVGFASIPSAARRYSTLSAGERFRCDVARALLDGNGFALDASGRRRDLTVVDEFSSAVDREVARASAIALRKALDSGAFGARKFVAVTCHSDVAPWLEPDWILDMTTGKLTRGRLRRPTLLLRLYAGGRKLWPYFKDYHYLSGALNRSARVFVGTLAAPGERERLAIFAALLPLEGFPGARRVHRLVARPEYQGIGLGGATLDALGALCAASGERLRVVSGNVFFTRKLARSPRWRLVGRYPHGKTQRRHGRAERGSFGRAIASFEYVGTNG